MSPLLAGGAGSAPAGRPSVLVRIPTPLRELTGGVEDVTVPAATVAEALDGVAARHPALRRHLRADGGGVRPHVNVYVNEDEIRDLDGEATPVSDGDVIMVLASLAGG